MKYKEVLDQVPSSGSMGVTAKDIWSRLYHTQIIKGTRNKRIMLQKIHFHLWKGMKAKQIVKNGSKRPHTFNQSKTYPTPEVISQKEPPSLKGNKDQWPVTVKQMHYIIGGLTGIHIIIEKTKGASSVIIGGEKPARIGSFELEDFITDLRQSCALVVGIA